VRRGLVQHLLPPSLRAPGACLCHVLVYLCHVLVVLVCLGHVDVLVVLVCLCHVLVPLLLPVHAPPCSGHIGAARDVPSVSRDVSSVSRDMPSVCQCLFCVSAHSSSYAHDGRL